MTTGPGKIGHQWKRVDASYWRCIRCEGMRYDGDLGLTYRQDGGTWRTEPFPCTGNAMAIQSVFRGKP